MEDSGAVIKSKSKVYGRREKKQRGKNWRERKRKKERKRKDSAEALSARRFAEKSGK
jgi:hypothetical protein